MHALSCLAIHQAHSAHVSTLPDDTILHMNAEQ